MCHDKEDSLLPRGTRDAGVYFGVIGRGTPPCAPSHQWAQVKARWHPVAMLKDRWEDEFLTHFGTSAQNRSSRQGLTAFILSVGVWLDRLAEMQMIISCAFFYFFFIIISSMKAKGWQADLLKHSGLQDCMSGPSLGGLMDSWLTGFYEWIGRVHANK